MASVVIDVVLEKLGGMLLEEINKEVSLVCNFTSDFEWLSKKLTNLRDYLRDADAQSAHSASVKSWLLDVADITWDAEDILDECALQSKGTHGEISQSSCVCAFSYSQLLFRYKMAHRIKDVKDRLRSIMKGGKELKLVGDVTHSDQPSTSASGNARWRGSNVMENASRPVAIESKVEDVLRLLNVPAAPVIAVVGMGGVGKTFLMQNAFDRAKGGFERSIWLAVSQTYSLQKLQAALASKIDLKEVVEGRVDEVQASQLIHESLTRREGRTLIVLDDVWRATGEDNLISALGLPTGNNTQCKIVVTTRSKHVSSYMNARVYELHPLSEEESWDLFCAFAFEGNQPPHHVEGIAREIEGKCGRLPLAVKTVAASLANKTLSRDWTSKLEQLRAISYTEDPIMQILKMSYDSLPPHLKPCFAYLSFFPEDEEIDYLYLINLWVAEGYVPQGDDQLDVGWSYICHLQSLCLVERVNDEDGLDWSDRRFRLHDLLLDLAISIAKESQSAFSVEEAFKTGPTVQTSSRHVRRLLLDKKSIGNDDVDEMARNRAYSAACLRTLSFSQNRGIENIPAILVNGARVLRVLDLSGTAISSLPDCVGNLKLLTVLNLSRTDITKLPDCVKGNKSLRFLDLSYCIRLEQFPEWIGELNCLQHLDIRPVRERYIPKGISKLVSLQVLKLDGDNKLSVQENDFLKLEHFANLVNLREVWINISDEAELKRIEEGILATLVKMRNLSIGNNCSDEGNLPPLSDKMLDMKDLEYLCLVSFAVPNWICRFSNLMHLQLWNCYCAEYPALETMPNLIKLELFEDDICEALPTGFGKAGGFPKLQSFRIQEFQALEELPELEDGAMPRLEILHVSACHNLKNCPHGLELLKSLKECRFRGTGVDDMFKKGGELWNKIKANNPNVLTNE